MKVESARVVNASPMELVIISYEIVFDDIKEAKDAIERNEFDLMKTKLHNANGFIKNLSEALDMSYMISHDLRRLYDYTQKKIIETIINRREENLVEVEDILNKLYSSFKEISKEEKNKNTMMSNCERVYTGLTYGMNGLNETVLGYEKKGIKI